MRAELVRLVEGIPALDALGEAHRAEALAWLRRTDDVYRRERPAVPNPHLVVYVLLVDRAEGAVLLGDHRLSGLRLPVGGHVDPGEAPIAAARRELREELGVALRPDPRHGDRPFLLTVTETVGEPAARHTDVSLWFAGAATRDSAFEPDDRELRAVHWWTRAALTSADPAGFEPHLLRALDLLGL